MPTSSVILALLVQLSISFPTAQAAEPTCTNIADFENCPGNAHSFCPRGIACGCKDQMPFCKCPTYRNGWQDYWYMGPKCDQLWSTLDLVLVAAVPGIALALAAAVIMQWVGYCGSRPRAQARRPRPEVLFNPLTVPNLDDKSRSISQQKGNEEAGAAQYVRFPRLSVQSHVYQQPPLPMHAGGFSYTPRQQTVPVERGPFVNQRDARQSKIPDIDYGDENPFSTMPMQWLPVCQSPGSGWRSPEITTDLQATEISSPGENCRFGRELPHQPILNFTSRPTIHQ